MNRDEAKALLPILTAFAEGKPLQVYSSFRREWVDHDFIPLGHPATSFRIKPEPKLRPWKPEECPNNFMLMRSGNGHGTTCVAWKNSDQSGVNIMHAAISKPDHPWTDHVTFEDLSRHYVRIDENGTEHPCGILDTTEAAGEAP